MHTLRSAVLEHTTAQGVHHDWLIEDPSLNDPHAPGARLWTARVLPQPTQWAALGRFHLEVIPPHRRVYLDKQGPISGDRGRVRRVAAGHCMAERWSEGRILLRMDLREIHGWIDLRRLSGHRWFGVCL